MIESALYLDGLLIHLSVYSRLDILLKWIVRGQAYGQPWRSW